MGDLIARVLENDEARFFLTLLAIAGAFVWILSAISSTAQNAPRDPERPYRKRRPAIRRRGSSLSSTGSRGKGPGARALGFDECPSAQPRAFRLDDLPSELILDIMETSALRWSSSYTTLRLVSRRLNTLADRACLIHVPVLLTNAHKTIAFRTFLDRRPRALPYVRHLWVAPALDAEGDLAYVAAIVLRRCTNLRSLACTARMLHEAIAHAPLFRTECCRRLTILAPPAPGVGGDAWGDLRGNATVTNFLGRVTHMRIAGEIPRLRDGEVFARLTHLSIVYEGPVGQITEDLAALTDDAKTHGTLRRVVITVRGISRTIPYGDQWKSKGQRWMVLALPFCWNEVDMWKNQVRGRGLWDIISGRLVST
ncbi:hypothetical protein BD626DRAFT_493455 [Schizophyllum amplum]|uniref:F-box domain-containing protein n=1 Tax=Schizophyllum amplum TaxID=97359 RepID=A0A550CGS1_9AGAR|nr:hypothetical protein BD626DRAFT_493455 [Auriculariopsis ampla]